jgi:hypothetical protein
MESANGNPFGRPPDQFGFVVGDVETSAKLMFEIFALQPWLGFEYNGDSLPRRVLHGMSGNFETRSVVWGRGRLSLIQPVAGESVYSETLERRGPGLHHVGYFVESIAATRAWLADRGYVEVMSGGGHGVDGDGEFAFFGLDERLGCLLEVMEQPARRRSPDFVLDWGAATDGR